MSNGLLHYFSHRRFQRIQPSLLVSRRLCGDFLRRLVNDGPCLPIRAVAQDDVGVDGLLPARDRGLGVEVDEMPAVEDLGVCGDAGVEHGAEVVDGLLREGGWIVVHGDS